MKSSVKLLPKLDLFFTKYFSGDTLDYKQIFQIILPLLIGQGFLVSMSLINTMMISSTGVEAVSAVNMVESLNIFLVNIFIAIVTGGSVVIAQYKGSGQIDKVTQALSNLLVFVFILSLSIGLLLIIFHQGVLQLLFGKASPTVFRQGTIFFLGSCASFVGIAITEGVSGALRGMGETRSSLFLTLTMYLSYLILNFFLIGVMDLGVWGLAISINVSRYLAAGVALFYLSRRQNPPRLSFRHFKKVDLSMMKRIASIGIPFSAESMFFNGGKILTQTFVVGMGTYALGVNALTSSISGFFAIPANALSLTIVTVVGQCMGRKDLVQARKVIKSFHFLAAFSLFLWASLLLPFLHPIISLFKPPEEIIQPIFILMCLFCVMQALFWAPSFLMPAALRAAGDSKYSSIASMLSMWLFRVCVGYFLGVTLNWGIYGVWYAMFGEWIVRGIIFQLRFRGSKWYKHKVI